MAKKTKENSEKTQKMPEPKKKVTNNCVCQKSAKDTEHPCQHQAKNGDFCGIHKAGTCKRFAHTIDTIENVAAPRHVAPTLTTRKNNATTKCMGTTKAGKPCQKNCSKGSQYCHLHRKN